jgi:hypothetical protein
MAVRSGLCNEICTDDGGSTRAVVDNDRLTDVPRQSFANLTGADIDDRAR